MKKRKLHLRIEDGISDEVALERALSVVKNGRQSRDANCYCFICTFSDGTAVYSELTRKGEDTMLVYRQESAQ